MIRPLSSWPEKRCKQWICRQFLLSLHPRGFLTILPGEKLLFFQPPGISVTSSKGLSIKSLCSSLPPFPSVGRFRPESQLGCKLLIYSTSAIFPVLRVHLLLKLSNLPLLPPFLLWPSVSFLNLYTPFSHCSPNRFVGFCNCYSAVRCRASVSSGILITATSTLVPSSDFYCIIPSYFFCSYYRNSFDNWLFFHACLFCFCRLLTPTFFSSSVSFVCLAFCGAGTCGFKPFPSWVCHCSFARSFCASWCCVSQSWRGFLCSQKFCSKSKVGLTKMNLWWNEPSFSSTYLTGWTSCYACGFYSFTIVHCDGNLKAR